MYAHFNSLKINLVCDGLSTDLIGKGNKCAKCSPTKKKVVFYEIYFVAGTINALIQHIKLDNYLKREQT